MDAGGGLLAGVAAYVKRVRPEVRSLLSLDSESGCLEVAVIGVEAEDAAAMTQSLLAGRRVALTDVGLFADGAGSDRGGVRDA